jgi:hypothetical protein
MDQIGAIIKKEVKEQMTPLLNDIRAMVSEVRDNFNNKRGIIGPSQILIGRGIGIDLSVKLVRIFFYLNFSMFIAILLGGE